jgi:predicted MFS family arabinose efflux permease
MSQVWLLSAATALCTSGSFLVVLLGGILGARLAPAASLATLPASAMVVGVALGTLPAAAAMQRFGRRPAFLGSALLAAAASGLAALAVARDDFWLFCLATFLLGANNAVVMQYRFAAAECVEPGRAGQAIAVVMSGALVAALLGPEIGVRAGGLVEGARYSGSFVAAVLLYLAAFAVLLRLPGGGATAAGRGGGGRPLSEIARQPAFVVAVLAGVVSYAVMSFIMTATPISMHVIDHHPEHHTKFVIQSHLLAMYLPALVSGRIVGRLGTHATMALGTLTMAGCVAIGAAGGHEVLHYWWAMVLLGAGWNLLFVAGTTLLTTTYRPEERFRAQALNEFAVFGSQALASLLAGVALSEAGWSGLNLASLPLLAAMLAALLLSRGRRALPAR